MIRLMIACLCLLFATVGVAGEPGPDCKPEYKPTCQTFACLADVGFMTGVSWDRDDHMTGWDAGVQIKMSEKFMPFLTYGRREGQSFSSTTDGGGSYKWDHSPSQTTFTTGSRSEFRIGFSYFPWAD